MRMEHWRLAIFSLFLGGAPLAAQTAAGWGSEWKSMKGLSDLSAGTFRKTLDKKIEDRKFAEALPVAIRWQAEEKTDEDALKYLGMLQQVNNDPTSAVDTYSRLLAMKPDPGARLEQPWLGLF